MNSPASKAGPDRLLLVGLVGAGIQDSQSPSMHMEEAQALGLRYRYELIDIDRIAGGIDALPRLLDDAQARGFAGLNITYPCKQAVIPLLDELSADASSLHSVNTVVFRDGRRVGQNTDWWGFAENFRRGMKAARRDRVVLIGAGGAGAAVGYAALQLGTRHLTVVDLDRGRAIALAKRLQEHFPDQTTEVGSDVAAALDRADGLIHASPTGMAKLPGLPVPESSLHPPLWVAEVVYVPLETQLLRIARSRGCLTLDGGGMAVFQAAMAFEFFSGVKPDAERMLETFNQKLRGGA